jgi:hypothetical protein
MDYLFVPGSGRAENLGRRVLQRRPNTLLVTPRRRDNHVAGLLARLATLAPTAANPNPRPIGDTLLVAHGNETGEYFLKLARALDSPTTFELVDDANNANVVRLTAALLTPAGGGPLNTITVRLRGCNIGAARPFVEKLQEAMAPAGGTLNMTAPLHFDEFHDIGGGTVEYLAHKFTVTAPQQFRLPPPRPRQLGASDRPALLAAFAGKNFTFLDGTAIPAGDWTNFIPNEIHPPRRRWHQTFPMDVDLDPPVGAQTMAAIHREYRYDQSPFSWNWHAPNPAIHQRGNQPRPLTNDERDILRDTLPQGGVPPSNRHLYDPDYPWPLYERFGVTNLGDFVDNLDWTVTFDGRTLHFRTVRHEYTVMLPITDPPAPPARPVLRFYNFFAARRAAVAADFHLDETNADLYLIL